MSKKTSLITIITLIVIIIGLTFYTVNLKQEQTAQSAPREPIKVGFIGALTGDAAYYGESDRNSMALAVEEINSNGGINGQQIKVIYEDGKCNGKDATEAAQKLINIDQVKIIFGGTCSSETLAIAPIAEENKVLVFSSMSSGPDVSEAGDYIFRNAASDTDNGLATADLAYKNGIRKIAIISENTDYATGFSNVFEQRFNELGGEILYAETFAPKTTDFRGIITKVTQSEPEAILVSPQGEAGALALKQIKQAGFSGQLYGNTILGDSNIIELAEGSAKGLYYSDPAGLSSQNPKAAHFLEAYQAKYNAKPSLEFYSGARYDSVYLIAQAIKEVGTDASKIKDYLYNLDGFEGVLGNVSFNSNGDIKGIQFTDYQIKDNKIIEVK